MPFCKKGVQNIFKIIYLFRGGSSATFWEFWDDTDWNFRKIQTCAIYAFLFTGKVDTATETGLHTKYNVNELPSFVFFSKLDKSGEMYQGEKTEVIYFNQSLKNYQLLRSNIQGVSKPCPPIPGPSGRTLGKINDCRVKYI